MKRPWLLSIAALSLWATCARADAAPAAVSPFTLPLEPLRLNALVSLGENPVTLETVGFHGGYAHPHYGRAPGFGSQSQIYAGVFEPSTGNQQGFVLGIRGGPKLSPNLQIGAAFDWEHRSSTYGTVVGSSAGPGGTVIVTREITSSSENTFPLMAYLQLSGSEKRAVVPYLGIAGGYEIVSLVATDYATSSYFSATYGGWGWQSWAGVRVPFSPHSGILAEVYTNQATAYRDVYDPYYGVTLRESVGLDGFGARFGLSWGIF